MEGREGRRPTADGVEARHTVIVIVSVDSKLCQTFTHPSQGKAGASSQREDGELSVDSPRANLRPERELTYVVRFS